MEENMCSKQYGQYDRITISKWKQTRRDSLNKAIGIINITDEDPRLRVGSFAIVNLRVYVMKATKFYKGKFKCRLYSKNYSNGITLMICDITKLVNPSNTENRTLITHVVATTLLILYILVIKNFRKIPQLTLVVMIFKIFRIIS